MRLRTSSGKQKRRKLITVRKVVGDSMLPTLPQRTLVIGTSLMLARPGCVVIVHHDGKEKIKRVHSIEHGKVFLLGDNPSRSSDGRHFGWLSLDDVIGVVIWPRHAVKL